MEIKELIDFIFQYGVGIACLIYLMYFQSTTMKDLTNNQNVLNATMKDLTNNQNELNVTLREVNTNLSNINLRLNDIEEKVKRGE